MSFFRKYKYPLLVALVILTGAFLRFYKLDYQSLWYDELYTVNEANPDTSWKQLFYYCQTDQHPPFYFILQRFTFILFGYTEWAARALSAFAGVSCIWAMYLLGKTLLEKKLGLIAAVIMCTNQYNIRYSHDARPYTLTWLLVILSYLFFLRTLKYLKKTDAAWYTITTIALLYTNYFGFLALLSQALIAFIFFIHEKHEKKKFFLTFLTSALLIVCCYIPWYKYLIMQSGLKPFWLQKEPSSFLFIYYYAYFGGERFLVPFLIIAPSLWIWHLYKRKKEPFNPRINPIQLISIFILLSIAVPFIVLYLRSVLYSPVLQQRYTIVVLPGLHLMVAYGIYLIRPVKMSFISALIFWVIAVLNLVFRHNFYSFPTEMQYRQTAAYVAAYGKNFTIINSANGWHMHYYMKKNNYTGRVIRENKYKAVDAILRRKHGYDIDTFWIISGFLDHPLQPLVKKNLDTAFIKIREGQFNVVSAELYGRRNYK